MRRGVIYGVESEMQYRTGQIYLARFVGYGNTQHGVRPCVIIQNNIGNKYSPNVIVLPITSSIKKITQPTHVLLSADNTGLFKDSLVLCENPVTLSKELLGKYITTLSDEYMRQICLAYIKATSIEYYLNIHIA